MKFFDKTWKLALSGAVAGLLVALLAIYGNPANMAICVACFIRDSAGALKLHTAAPVQYFRPEIVGFVCGSFLLALLTKEYKSTAGSSPMVRFILGVAMMIGALVFLGCPLRMVLRMSAGDLNAWVALIGFAGARSSSKRASLSAAPMRRSRLAAQSCLSCSPLCSSSARRPVFTP